jgi:hypothetical protein
MGNAVIFPETVMVRVAMKKADMRAVHLECMVILMVFEDSLGSMMCGTGILKVTEIKEKDDQRKCGNVSVQNEDAQPMDFGEQQYETGLDLRKTKEGETRPAPNPSLGRCPVMPGIFHVSGLVAC